MTLAGFLIAKLNRKPSPGKTGSASEIMLIHPTNQIGRNAGIIGSPPTLQNIEKPAFNFGILPARFFNGGPLRYPGIDLFFQLRHHLLSRIDACPHTIFLVFEIHHADLSHIGFN